MLNCNSTSSFYTLLFLYVLSGEVAGYEIGSSVPVLRLARVLLKNPLTLNGTVSSSIILLKLTAYQNCAVLKTMYSEV